MCSEFGTIATLRPATVKFRIGNMKQPRNIVGPQIRAIREKRGLTQLMLAAKCHVLGWDLSRETLAKIESQVRWVADAEMVCLAASLKVPLETLLPSPGGLKRFFNKAP